MAAHQQTVTVEILQVSKAEYIYSIQMTPLDTMLCSLQWPIYIHVHNEIHGIVTPLPLGLNTIYTLTTHMHLQKKFNICHSSQS